MKLKEMSTDKTLDVLCDLVQPVSEIMEDKKLVEAFFKKATVDEKAKGSERKAIGLMQVAKNFKVFVPSLLKKHRNSVYEILSIVNEKPIDEIKKQSPIETINQIKELAQDEDLISFFSSQDNVVEKQSSTSTSSEEAAE